MSNEISKQRALTPRERLRCLIAISACTASAGLAFGLTLPLLALLMERQSAPTTFIAIMGGLYALAAVLFMPFIPRIITHVSAYKLIVGGILIGALSLLAMLVTDNYWIWILPRFIMAIGSILMITLSEIWLNQIADDASRGRYMGIFAASLSGGFAGGPALLHFTGIGGPAPFVVGSLLMLLALVPLRAARDLTPDFRQEKQASFWALLFVAPAATFAALAYGAIETGAFSLLPLYAVRNGFSEENAALFLTLIGIGNVIVQYPIGWLADRYDTRLVLIGCAAMGIFGAISLPLFIHTPWLLFPSLVLWGGVIVGLYTAGLILLGQRFKGASLASANAAFVFMFGIGALMGPLMTGPAMDAVGPQGLPLVLGLIAAAYTILATQRYFHWKKRENHGYLAD
jgi:MFS family permease